MRSAQYCDRREETTVDQRRRPREQIVSSLKSRRDQKMGRTACIRPWMPHHRVFAVLFWNIVLSYFIRQNQYKPSPAQSEVNRRQNQSLVSWCPQPRGTPGDGRWEGGTAGVDANATRDT
jgi:hypothetical protein